MDDRQTAKNTHLCSTRVWTEYCAKTTLSWRIPVHKYQLYNPNVSVCSQLLLNTKCQPSCQLHLTAVWQLRYTSADWCYKEKYISYNRTLKGWRHSVIRWVILSVYQHCSATNLTFSYCTYMPADAITAKGFWFSFKTGDLFGRNYLFLPQFLHGTTQQQIQDKSSAVA